MSNTSPNNISTTSFVPAKENPVLADHTIHNPSGESQPHRVDDKPNEAGDQGTDPETNTNPDRSNVASASNANPPLSTAHTTASNDLALAPAPGSIPVPPLPAALTAPFAVPLAAPHAEPHAESHAEPHSEPPPLAAPLPAPAPPAPAPIIPAPIIPAPIIPAPIIPAPIVPAPIVPAPIVPAPIVPANTDDTESYCTSVLCGNLISMLGSLTHNKATEDVGKARVARGKATKRDKKRQDLETKANSLLEKANKLLPPGDGVQVPLGGAPVPPTGAAGAAEAAVPARATALQTLYECMPAGSTMFYFYLISTIGTGCEQNKKALILVAVILSLTFVIVSSLVRKANSAATRLSFRFKTITFTVFLHALFASIAFLTLVLFREPMTTCWYPGLPTVYIQTIPVFIAVILVVLIPACLDAPVTTPWSGQLGIEDTEGHVTITPTSAAKSVPATPNNTGAGKA